MKIWEAILMLQEMDQSKEVTVTFGQAAKKPFEGLPKYDTVYPRFVPDTNDWWPKQPIITCKVIH